MRFTLSWLKDYLETDATILEITDTLTSIGLEVDEILDRSEELKDFIIATIISAEKHLEADKLKICQVDNGTEILQIVCGASNAREGIKVVLAPIGAIIPTNKMVIKKSKIRNVESNGMLCSYSELGMNGEDQGIIEVKQNTINGAKFAEVYDLCDPVITIGITPNRGDCLGVYGIARDLAATGIGTLKEIKYDKIDGEFDSPIKISIKSDLCLAYYGRYFKDVKYNKNNDLITKRLTAIGVKIISPIVDLTNYISYSFNRPAHAYDADTIKGNIIVRCAKGEKFIDLSEKQHILNDELVIADDEKILALAGIIGGLNSAVTENTKNIFIEIACFDADHIALVGRKLNILTDARYRFERKLDNNFARVSMDIMSSMISHAKVSDVVDAGDYKNTTREIIFNPNIIKKLTGLDLDLNLIDKILKNLGFIIEQNNSVMTIIIPSWRNDVHNDADLVEEILRIYGYDKLILTPLPNISNKKDLLSSKQIKIQSVRRMLSSHGLNEVINWSFINSDIASHFTIIKDELKLLNPISNELSYMRPSLIPGLIDLIKKNASRQFHNLSFFEIGNIYKSVNIEDQTTVIAGIKSGKKTDKNIYNDDRILDFYDIKADYVAIIQELGFDENKLILTNDVPDFLHPGKSAIARLGKNIIGYFGELHPTLLKKMDVKTNILAFEIFPNMLPDIIAKKSKYEVSDYPAITRDFAFIMDMSKKVSDVIRLIRACDKELISHVKLFDLYTGSKIEADKKSMAFAVTIQASNRTLTDVEIESVSNKIINSIESIGGNLRK